MIEENGNLREIIEEICYINNEKYGINSQAIVTRETGQSRPDRIPNSRISIIDINDGEIHVWRPFLTEIFNAISHLYHTAGRHY